MNIGIDTDGVLMGIFWKQTELIMWTGMISRIEKKQ